MFSFGHQTMRKCKRRDRKVKTEGHKIISNDIQYFQTVIIGSPKQNNTSTLQEQFGLGYTIDILCISVGYTYRL